MARSGSLIIQDAGGRESSHALVPGILVTLGRLQANSIVLKEEHCSRKHAELYDHDGDWFVRDCGTLNGTFVDEERITDPVVLSDGQTIRIGHVRLTVSLDASSENGKLDDDERTPPTELLPLGNQPCLQLDGFTALCQFMADAVIETDSTRLIRRALRSVLQQTRSALVGFLGLDAEKELVPRLVLPDAAKVDMSLSRSLTRTVAETQSPAWLGSERTGIDSQCLSLYSDAICIPVVRGGYLLGALHAYRSTGAFRPQDFSYCEVIGHQLASNLQLLRGRHHLEAENSRLKMQTPVVVDRLIGASKAIAKLRQLIDRAAPLDSTVLIRGESGAGKELVAQSLHEKSPRRDGALVVINCAAIPAELMESQLFGHKRGAFTDASADHDGFFRQADGGTLFLDEIGELSQPCQAKLLRVLEGKGFIPVGSSQTIRVDVRIISATHRDLEKEVSEGRFRADLYYRLKVVEINVPPLREHKEDIPELIEYFLGRIQAKTRRRTKLTDAAHVFLVEQDWPGNVRQLQYALESAVVLADDDIVDVTDLRPRAESSLATPQPSPFPTLNLDELNRLAVEEALRRTKDDVDAAAELLGINRATVYQKMKDSGVRPRKRPGKARQP